MCARPCCSSSSRLLSRVWAKGLTNDGSPSFEAVGDVVESQLLVVDETTPCQIDPAFRVERQGHLTLEPRGRLPSGRRGTFQRVGGLIEDLLEAGETGRQAHGRGGQVEGDFALRCGVRGEVQV